MLRAKVLPPLSFHWDTHPKEGPNLENQAVGGKRGYRVGYAGVDRTLACSDGPGVGGRSKGGGGEGNLVLGHLNIQGSKPVSKGFQTSQYLPLFYPKLELPFGLFDKNKCH